MGGSGELQRSVLGVDNLGRLLIELVDEVAVSLRLAFRRVCVSDNGAVGNHLGQRRDGLGVGFGLADYGFVCGESLVGRSLIVGHLLVGGAHLSAVVSIILGASAGLICCLSVCKILAYLGLQGCFFGVVFAVNLVEAVLRNEGVNGFLCLVELRLHVSDRSLHRIVSDVVLNVNSGGFAQFAQRGVDFGCRFSIFVGADVVLGVVSLDVGAQIFD